MSWENLFMPYANNKVLARRRSACTSAQSDQHLCCSLPRSYNTSSFYIRNFKPLPSFCGCAGRFESTLVANPEDRFSRDGAQVILTIITIIFIKSVEEKSRRSINLLTKRALKTSKCMLMKHQWTLSSNENIFSICLYMLFLQREAESKYA